MSTSQFSSIYYAPDFLKTGWANANPTHPILSSLIKFIPLLLQISAVARNQILGGHKVNRGVWNGGAQVHKTKNIGWALARVPTVQIWPCKYIAKMHLWAGSKVGFTQPLLWDSSKDMSRTKVWPFCPVLFSKGSHCVLVIKAAAWSKKWMFWLVFFQLDFWKENLGYQSNSLT